MEFTIKQDKRLNKNKQDMRNILVSAVDEGHSKILVSKSLLEDVLDVLNATECTCVWVNDQYGGSYEKIHDIPRHLVNELKNALKENKR